MAVRMQAPGSSPVKDALTLLQLAMDPAARKAELDELLRGREAYDTARLAAEDRLAELKDLEPQAAAIEAKNKEAEGRLALAQDAEAQLGVLKEQHRQEFARRNEHLADMNSGLDRRDRDLTDREEAIEKRELRVAQETFRLQELQDQLEAKEKKLNDWHQRLSAAVAE